MSLGLSECRETNTTQMTPTTRRAANTSFAHSAQRARRPTSMRSWIFFGEMRTWAAFTAQFQQANVPAISSRLSVLVLTRSPASKSSSARWIESNACSQAQPGQCCNFAIPWNSARKDWSGIYTFFERKRDVDHFESSACLLPFIPIAKTSNSVARKHCRCSPARARKHCRCSRWCHRLLCLCRFKCRLLFCLCQFTCRLLCLCRLVCQWRHHTSHRSHHLHCQP